MTWPPTPGAAPLDAFEAARQRLLAALAGLKEEQCRSHPEPGAQSVLDALGVLVAYERAVAGAARASAPAPEALPPTGEAEALARGAQLMMPALVHDLNAATNDLRTALGALAADGQAATATLVVRALDRATARVDRNAELLGVR